MKLQFLNISGMDWCIYLIQTLKISSVNVLQRRVVSLTWVLFRQPPLGRSSMDKSLISERKWQKKKFKSITSHLFFIFCFFVCYYFFPKMSLLCPTTKISLSDLFQPPVRYEDKGGLICHIDTAWPLTFICSFLNLGSDISVVQSPHTQNALNQIIWNSSIFNNLPKRGCLSLVHKCMYKDIFLILQQAF